MNKMPYEDLVYGKKVGALLRGETVEVKERKKPSYEEADLHLKFCKWVKKWYPELQFVRHEREKKRSLFMQNLMKSYNTDWDKLPDFELLKSVDKDFDGDFKQAYRHPVVYCGLYIEFKKPGEKWLQKDGLTIKKEYQSQHIMHRHLWSIGRCSYFCNDFEDAKRLLKDYLDGKPQIMQDYLLNDLHI